ncbi:3-methyladenine DNA glycosylase [Cryptosporangium sp. NPDC051539]|uniref:3-methyladenine DNA glycosylase n=1 Tax=Cryptosporangium sp. NPDC051539 TaxID=3363962 RepID=UPI0037B56214
MTVLSGEEWRARRDTHAASVDALLRDHLARRRRGERHPVEDFLFEYYSFRPGQLRRWHPGAGVVLAEADPDDFPGYTAVEGGVVLDLDAYLARRSETVDWVAGLLRATASRPPQLGCFGMHEWAMVYRIPDVRHDSWPLRLGAERTNAVVDERGVRCSHFDAFRFFTEPARPLNVLQPARETQVALEQPGCLHATMDLYKWAYKLSPLTPSDLVLDCFRLTKSVRELDMKASPYDFAALGYEPVGVETPEGRAEYAAAQRAFAERGGILRSALLRVIDQTRAGAPARRRP